MTKSHSEVRGLLIAFLAALVLMAAVFPLAQMLDKRDDRQRRMYKDVLSVALLEYNHSQNDGHVQPAELRGGHSTAIGKHHYRPSRGVTVWVKLNGDGFCVRGRNQYGDVTKWQCGDASTPPASLGALAPPK